MGHNETTSELRIAAEYFFSLLVWRPFLIKDNYENDPSACPFLNINLEKKKIFFLLKKKLINLNLKATILGVRLMFGAISMTSIQYWLYIFCIPLLFLLHPYDSENKWNITAFQLRNVFELSPVSASAFVHFVGGRKKTFNSSFFFILIHKIFYIIFFFVILQMLHFRARSFE